jgi:7-dehydrocholesterol reductase
MKVTYKDATGKQKESKLLLSGWWGVTRKINYTFELLAAFLWSSVAGLRFGVWPFLYFLFLLALLMHRVFRGILLSIFSNLSEFMLIFMFL